VLDYSIGKVATVFTRVSILIIALSIVCGAILTSLMALEEAQAVPAFARKYNTNCMDWHTAPPMLNAFGQRFLENGYQLPGTEDGGSTGKNKLGDLNLDDVNWYVSFRFMQTYRLVFDDPYFGQTTEAGQYAITGVSSVLHRITVWHETLGLLEKEVLVPARGTAVVDLEYK